MTKYFNKDKMVTMIEMVMYIGYTILWFGAAYYCLFEGYHISTTDWFDKLTIALIVGSWLFFGAKTFFHIKEIERFLTPEPKAKDEAKAEGE